MKKTVQLAAAWLLALPAYAAEYFLADVSPANYAAALAIAAAKELRARK